MLGGILAALIQVSVWHRAIPIEMRIANLREDLEGKPNELFGFLQKRPVDFHESAQFRLAANVAPRNGDWINGRSSSRRERLRKIHPMYEDLRPFAFFAPIMGDLGNDTSAAACPPSAPMAQI